MTPVLSPRVGLPNACGVSPLLSVIILVFNRREALARTLAELDAALVRLWVSVCGATNPDEARSAGDPRWLGLAEVIVVDNASTDGSGTMVRARFPHCRVVEMEQNAGVAGFNRGVEAASGAYLLILDDDAWPEGDSLSGAMEVLESEPGVAGVMFQPVHPGSGALEWPFDRVKERTRDWPDLRCANLVRREAWNAVGGYEAGFFLYRNDTDLALKLLGAGLDVCYDPAWRAMHDSPHIAVRRVKWFYLSTRNWGWMCRRHGRGAAALVPLCMGWLWAHRLAGMSPARHWSALRGGLAGLLRSPPAVPDCVRRDGRGLRRLIGLKRSLRA